MSKNKVIVPASIIAAILATGLLGLNLSMVGNAEALIPGEFVFCLEYTELCQVEENVPSGITACPAGTDLEGHVVLEGNAPTVCDIGILQLLVCPGGTNLAGAIVTDLVLCDLD